MATINPEDFTAERDRTSSKKKNTKDWCKGKVGREHLPVVARNHSYGHLPSCAWVPRFARDESGAYVPNGYFYRCTHALQCQVCGKYLTYILDADDCPTITERPTDD